MTKFILILIIMFNGHPEAENIGSFDDMHDCNEARIQIFKRIGVPAKNYQAVCLMQEII